MYRSALSILFLVATASLVDAEKGQSKHLIQRKLGNSLRRRRMQDPTPFTNRRPGTSTSKDEDDDKVVPAFSIGIDEPLPQQSAAAPEQTVVVPEALASMIPSDAPSMIPSDAPSLMPSSQPSKAPKSGSVKERRHLKSKSKSSKSASGDVQESETENDAEDPESGVETATENEEQEIISDLEDLVDRVESDLNELEDLVNRVETDPPVFAGAPAFDENVVDFPEEEEEVEEMFFNNTDGDIFDEVMNNTLFDEDDISDEVMNSTFFDEVMNITDEEELFFNATDFPERVEEANQSSSILIKLAEDESVCMMYNETILEAVECSAAGDLALWEIVESESPLLFQLRHVESGMCLPENPETPEEAFQCWIEEENQAIADAINGLVDCSSPFAAVVGFIDGSNPTHLHNALCATGEIGADSDVILMAYAIGGSTQILWGEKVLLDLIAGSSFDLVGEFIFEDAP